MRRILLAKLLRTKVRVAEVFFVELKWILWNSTLWPEHQSSLPPVLWIHKKYYLSYPLGFLDPSVLCKLPKTYCSTHCDICWDVQCDTRRNTHFCYGFGTISYTNYSNVGFHLFHQCNSSIRSCLLYYFIGFNLFHLDF